MKPMEDIRWKQRLQNYKRALTTITKAVELASSRELSELEKQGVIQGFEFSFELAWNVMKDFLEEQGISGIIGSKNAVRYAFQKELITDGQVWMDMIESRNLASHSYDEEKAENIYNNIIEIFYSQLLAFSEKMDTLEKECNTAFQTEQ
jgi:nucleotidyltransferase substrate binding protein (TIGR01987 family)